MRDYEERARLKAQYIEEWKRYKLEHPDMPLRYQYLNKRDYRRAKNEWNKAHTDYSGYLAKRFMELSEVGKDEISQGYPMFYLTELNKGLATLQRLSSTRKGSPYPPDEHKEVERVAG